ncbi:ATP-binding protein [Bradyrhizobium sp. CB3481]|uniref:sensor histidine kinase n=1 Tax=Bradyrhizobium sp. CB3481 TaxID=3039158 RepID=UPI0024B0CBD8|nr:ATP-binding protein [Bradyrhizobium sp. CB3481]WFU18526.1 ATP-binding protein [Bradyrhizobium sp. CB3481]
MLLSLMGPSDPAGAAEPEHKRILILHSVGREFRPWNEWAKAIRAELDRQSPWTVDVQEHSLIAARSADADAETLFLDYLQALYAGHPPDLVIGVGAPAASFIQRNRQRFFPATPTLFTTIEARRVQYSKMTNNDTVVAVTHRFLVLFESFLKISPETKVIAIVNGASPNELFWRGEMERELKPLEGEVEIRWYDKLSYEDTLKQLAALPPHSAIFWYQMVADAAGVAHEGDRALTRLFKVANAPIFSHDDAFFGEIVGGPMHSPLEGSRRAVGVAIRILNGEKPAEIRTQPSEFAPAKYDWRELQRWGISESLLPPGSTVYFREPSAWEKYRWQIAFVCAVMLVQAGLISILLYERRRRRVAEVEARRRMAELAHVNRYSMAGELTTSIAHELNQPLGSILVNTESAELLLNAPSLNVAELKEIISDIRRDDQRAGEVIRRLRSLLKRAPFEAQQIDLNDVVDESLDLVSGLAHARAVTVESVLSTEALPVQGDRIQLQQVLLNLILNATDAMATLDKSRRKVTVRTARDSDIAQVEVVDNGPGLLAGSDEIFEPFYTTKPSGMGMGLSIARTIVEAHEGEISAENRAGRGTVFRIRLPLASSALAVS